MAEKQYRQTVVYQLSGGREYTQVWIWHPARIVALRLHHDLRAGVKVKRTVLESSTDGVIYDSEWSDRGGSSMAPQ